MRWNLLLILILCYSTSSSGQTTGAMWCIADAHKRLPLDASLTVEIPGEYEALRFAPGSLHALEVKSMGNVHLLVLEPGYMLHSSVSHVPFSGVDTLLLRPLSIGMEQPLVQLEYVGGSFRLDARSLVSLEQLRAFMEMHPSMGLVLRGLAYSDQVQQCERTGRQRARSVWEYLVTAGIDPSRLRLEGRCGVSTGEPLVEIRVWTL